VFSVIQPNAQDVNGHQRSEEFVDGEFFIRDDVMLIEVAFDELCGLLIEILAMVDMRVGEEADDLHGEDYTARLAAALMRRVMQMDYAPRHAAQVPPLINNQTLTASASA
jgi:hypothetical protein